MVLPGFVDVSGSGSADVSKFAQFSFICAQVGSVGSDLQLKLLIRFDNE